MGLAAQRIFLPGYGFRRPRLIAARFVSEAESRFLLTTGLAIVKVTDLPAAEEGPLALAIGANIRRGACFHPGVCTPWGSSALRANIF